LFRTFLVTAAFYLLSNFLGFSQAHAFYFFEEENTNLETSKSFQRSELIIPPPVSSFHLQKQDLNRYLSNEEMELIKTDESEYALIKAASTTRNDKGIAILIPDWQQGLTNPKALNFLRKELPNQGWATFSVQSPRKPKNYPALLSIESELAEQNKTALMPYTNELKNLIAEVMKKARNYPGIFLVITQGSQAAMLIDLYKNNEDLAPSALVILSAGMYSTIENNTFAHNIATSSLPVLDLVLKRDNTLVLENAKLRKQYVNKEFKTLYRQKQLTNMLPGYYPEQTLITEINGWLKSIGW